MSFSDSLGIASLILGLVGTGVSIAFPNKRWIGWLFIVAAVVLAGWWGTIEYRGRFGHKITASTTPPAPLNPSAHSGTVTFTEPPGGWVTTWGVGPTPGTLQEIVNVTPLLPYSAHLHLLLICRIDDKTIDSMEDTSIEKSAMFSVSDEHPVLEMAMSQNFMSQAFPYKNVAMYLVLVPNPHTSEQISKLSDVKRIGGEIMNTSVFTLHVEKKVTKVRKPLPRNSV